MTGKLRAAYAEVGRDAPPYSYRPSLEYKTTSYGGYGYGFTGPNPNLKPEFAKSYEFGTELSFLNDRLGLDATFYRKQTTEPDRPEHPRAATRTGFILFNLNGAVDGEPWARARAARHAGAAPRTSRGTSWRTSTQRARQDAGLPNALPESYVSDTWLYGNVRNGTEPGLSTMSLTGLFYLRNKNGQLLIDPTTGLPLRSTHVHRRAATTASRSTRSASRTPSGTSAFTLELPGRLPTRRRRLQRDRALPHDPRARRRSTLDRNTPRVIPGVLRDGKENTRQPDAEQHRRRAGGPDGVLHEHERRAVHREEHQLGAAPRRDAARTRFPQRFGAERQRVRHRHGSVPAHQLHGPRSDRRTATTPPSAARAASASTTATSPSPRGFNFGFRVGF